MENALLLEFWSSGGIKRCISKLLQKKDQRKKYPLHIYNWRIYIDKKEMWAGLIKEGYVEKNLHKSNKNLF
jgi:hypothetical protein